MISFFYLGFEIDWNGLHFKFVVSMRFLNCTINPFIYLINYKDFQQAIADGTFAAERHKIMVIPQAALRQSL